MSQNDNYTQGSYLLSFSTVIAFDLQKEKNITREVAHSMMESDNWSQCNQTNLTTSFARSLE